MNRVYGRGCYTNIVTTYYLLIIIRWRAVGRERGAGGWFDSDPLTGRAIVSGVCLLAGCF